MPDEPRAPQEEKRKRRVQSPFTLFVYEVDFKPTPLEDGERVHPIDVEFTEHVARELVEYLTQRLAKDPVIGTIRVRCTGRLMLQ